MAKIENYRVDLRMKGKFHEVSSKYLPKIASIITDHVKVMAQNLAHETLLENYCRAWRDYKVASKDFQMLFLQYNNWILKEHRPVFSMSGHKEQFTNLEDMTNFVWKNNMLEQRGREITSLLWNAIKNDEKEVAKVQEVVQSFKQVNAVDLFEKLFFEMLGDYYKSKSIEWFQGLNAAEFIEKVLRMMEKEITWCKTFIPESSIDKMSIIILEKATEEHMDEMMMECQQMPKVNRKDELKKLYKILKMLPAVRFGQGRLTATLRITVRNEALHSSCLNMEEFEANLLIIYKKYGSLISEVFSDDPFCIDGLQKTLEYNPEKDRCDGTRMLEECINEVCSSKYYSVSESDLKALELKDLLPKLKLIFEKHNLPFTKPDKVPNLKHMLLREDEEFEQKKRRLSDSPELMDLN
ncbi:cullin-2-like [Cloeon dipterum]|uniref:cullin-2-like n=1 Tax=Cloeon dipterum TaxID=197152 RepID=UPI0032204104